MYKVLNACEQSGRVCPSAKAKIGADVMKIVNSCTVLQVTDKGYFFDAKLKAALETYFGLEDDIDD